MPRNVIQSLKRPCAATLWSVHTHPRPQLRYSSKPSSSAEEDPLALNRKRRNNIHLLRTADQKFLRETKTQLTALLATINAMKTQVGLLPATIHQLPSETPPYTFHFPNSHETGGNPAFAAAAEHALQTATRVREHVLDLQYEPYKDQEGESSNAVVAFGRELEGMSVGEKEAMLREWELEGEARQVRVERGSEGVLRFAREVFEDGKKELVRYSSGERRPLSRVEGKDAETKAEREKAAPPEPVSDLRALQSQLQSSINEKTK